MELSIDTSTRYASVALSDQGEAIAELTWHSQRNHSVELTPAVRELTSRAGLQMNELEAVFVARGPGGFSALRVGISTAKALALDIPLISVGTFDIEAEPYLRLSIPVCAVIEAGKSRFYLGSYAQTPENAPPVYDVVARDQIASHIRANTLFCGEGVHAIAGIIRERLGDSVQIADVPPPTRRAGLLAHLAYRRWQAGHTDDPATLQPLYLRSPQVNEAHQKWRRS